MSKLSEKRKKRLENEKARNSRTLFFDTKNLRKAVVRQLPLGEDDDVGFKVGLHFLGGGRAKPCPSIIDGEPCAACQARWALVDMDLKGKKAKEAEKIANRLRPALKFVMKIVDRADPEVVKVAEMPKTVYDVVFDVFDKDGEDLSDPEDGRDFRIAKEGTGFDTEYKVRILETSPLHEDSEVVADLVSQAEGIDIPSMYKTNSALIREAVEASLPQWVLDKISLDGDEPADLGEVDDEDEDEDEDEGREEAEDDEDEDEDELEEDDEDEEEADEDEDEDDEDEDEEEADDDEADEDDDEADEAEDDEDEDEDVDEEDDEDEDEDVEEEEQQAPRRRRRPTSGGSVERKIRDASSGKKKTSKKTSKKTGTKKVSKKTSKKTSKKVSKKAAGGASGKRRRVVRRRKS